MTQTDKRHEEQFLKALEEIFIGARIEGESGYIKLMKIKSSYFKHAVFPALLNEIDKACKPFEKGFREELFDKLYDFFSHYFSESGSIYFCNTAQHANIYEKVYTDDRDVILFWKTQMLYYVKTDRLFKSMDVDIDGEKFYFDVSGMELKRSNEKRELVYAFKNYQDGKIILTVNYSEKGKKTKNIEILKAVRAKGLTIDEEVLEKALRVFEKQSEVDFFINKDAQAFLEEQFDLWMYQYIFKGESSFGETRLKQIQTIKEIAYKIINYIARFEDELVKIWNKPKFVRNSNYVITIDKILGKNDSLLEKIFKHNGMQEQIAEWIALGMLDQNFKPEMILEKDLANAPLYPQYQHLPIDTKYFKDLELDILGLFADLDAELDGWLIHSENYQALNTIKPKFFEKIKCIHIDPPYNTDTSGFLYNNNYRHSSWLTFLENRISASINLISKNGSFLCHIDENEYERLKLFFDQINIPDAGTIIWDKRNPMNAGKGIAKQHEYIITMSKTEYPIYLSNENIILMLNKVAELIKSNGGITEKTKKEYSSWLDNKDDFTGGEKSYRYIDEDGEIYQSVSLRAPEPRIDQKFFIPLVHPVTNKPCPVPPNGFSRTPETLQSMIKNKEIIFGEDESIQPRQKVLLKQTKKRQISSIIQDAHKGKADLDIIGLNFPYCHPVSLYEKLNGAISELPNDIFMDFFAGSGTTAHAVMNLNRADEGQRKYILVEMGEHFSTVILPRIKKVAYSDKWKDGKAQKGQGISHFVKYFDLEQYEEVLSKANYQDQEAPLFATTPETLADYIFLRDLKMLEAVGIKEQKIKVNLEKLYPDIDLAETLSCLTGKWIKKITKDAVEFQDGSTANLSSPEWNEIKPLIWW